MESEEALLILLYDTVEKLIKKYSCDFDELVEDLEEKLEHREVI